MNTRGEGGLYVGDVSHWRPRDLNFLFVLSACSLMVKRFSPKESDAGSTPAATGHLSADAAALFSCRRVHGIDITFIGR